MKCAAASIGTASLLTTSLPAHRREPSSQKRYHPGDLPPASPEPRADHLMHDTDYRSTTKLYLTTNALDVSNFMLTSPKDLIAAQRSGDS
ncbi:hypothetical protein AB1N83_002618 [Pleurotus pulmonarius]